MRQVPKIKSMSLVRFVLSLYVSFHQSIWQIIDMIAFPEKVHIPESLKTSYKDLLDQLQDNNRTQQARIGTEEQVTSDSERDRLLSLIFFSITNGLRSAKEAILAAAKRLEIVIRPYRDIASLPLASETTAIRGLINDFAKEENSEAISALSLQPVIDELQAENEKFDAIYKDIVAEEAARSRKASTNDLRTQTDDVYNEICERIYASGLLATEPDDVTLITNIINEINGIIDDHRKTYNLSEGHKKKKEEGENEEDPENPNTGQSDEYSDETTSDEGSEKYEPLG